MSPTSVWYQPFCYKAKKKKKKKKKNRAPLFWNPGSATVFFNVLKKNADAELAFLKSYYLLIEFIRWRHDVSD